MIRLRPLLRAIAALASLAPVAAQAQPQRVVSMNLCTDQLAMMLGAPGQIISLSRLAIDPRSSVMAEQAQGYPINQGGAEEIWLLNPDLVVAGQYTSRATIEMLKRLGTPVVQLPPARSLADVPELLRAMGDALGRSKQAQALTADYEARLATLRADVTRRPQAAIYYANGYTTGNRTLAGEILIAAGFDNIAGEMSGGHLPLEELVMQTPEALITGRPFPGGSRSEEILAHPVLRRMIRDSAGRTVTDRDWICGTPHVLHAIEELTRFRKEIE